MVPALTLLEYFATSMSNPSDVSAGMTSTWIAVSVDRHPMVDVVKNKAVVVAFGFPYRTIGSNNVQM